MSPKVACVLAHLHVGEWVRGRVGERASGYGVKGVGAEVGRVVPAHLYVGKVLASCKCLRT